MTALGDAPCARLAQAAGTEPLWLTLRSLTGSLRMAAPASDVHVCENPSVLIAAADQLGKSSRPLVCTNGRPSAAALRLLTGLAESGASIHVRADDDDAGQAIVATVRRAIPDAKLRRFEARPPARSIPIGLDLYRDWFRPYGLRYQHRFSTRSGNDRK